MALIKKKNQSIYKAMDKSPASGRCGCRTVSSRGLGCCDLYG